MVLGLGLGIALAGLAMAPAGGAAETPTVLERRVKAAYLYKFAGYVDWPASAFHDANEPLMIAVLDDQALALELARLVQGRRSAGRQVQVRTLENPAEPGNAHVVFIGRGAVEHTDEVVAALGRRPVLVVGEAAAKGSMIRFVHEQGRVRFEVDLDAVEPSGLHLSSRLLTVARTVTSRRSG